MAPPNIHTVHDSNNNHPPQPPVMVRMLSFVEKPLKTTAVMVAVNLTDYANSTQTMLPLILQVLDPAGIRRTRDDVKSITILKEPLYQFARWLAAEAAAIPIGSTTSLGQNVQVSIKLDGRYSADSGDTFAPVLNMDLATAPPPGSTTAVPVPAHFWNDDDESDPNPRAVAFTLFPAILGTVVLNVAFDGAITIASEFPPFSVLADVDDFGSIMEPIGNSPEKRSNMVALGIREPENGPRGMHFLKCEFK
jgi:hypothetical protein